MKRRRAALAYIALAAGLAAGLLLLVVIVPCWLATEPSGETGAEPAAAGSVTRTIHARLFYVAEDGQRLVSVEQSIPFGEGTVEQARRIIEAQIAPPPDGQHSAIPAGTRLRAIYLTERGEAHVDFSPEISAAHPGGTTNEILTVYTIVNALTVNLPAISGVQLLVGGREVETLAGHIDLRRPLQQDLQWVAERRPAGGGK